MRNIMESGLYEHYENINSKSLKVCETGKTEGNPLGYLKLATLFFVLAIGMVSSSLIFIYELCHHHQPQKYPTDQHQQENLCIRTFPKCSRNLKSIVHQASQTDSGP